LSAASTRPERPGPPPQTGAYRPPVCGGAESGRTFGALRKLSPEMTFTGCVASRRLMLLPVTYYGSAWSV
jgi:hypothetical protein